MPLVIHSTLNFPGDQASRTPCETRKFANNGPPPPPPPQETFSVLLVVFFYLQKHRDGTCFLFSLNSLTYHKRQSLGALNERKKALRTDHAHLSVTQYQRPTRLSYFCKIRYRNALQNDVEAVCVMKIGSVTVLGLLHLGGVEELKPIRSTFLYRCG